MKTTLLSVLLLSTLVTLVAANPPVPPNKPSTAITGVSLSKDRRTLVIRYDLSGRAHEQRVTFKNEIAEFRYCRWLGGWHRFHDMRRSTAVNGTRGRI
jgi:hypothetical protein